jgi:hypothetical protein
MVKLFPSILPSDDDFVDDTYTEGELEKKEYDELSSIAAEHPSEEVHGRMGQSELRDKLEGLERVD